MTSSPDPQPCPCGAPLDALQTWQRMRLSQWQVVCPDCGRRSPRCATEAAALAAWDADRHAPAAATEEAESIAAAIEATHNVSHSRRELAGLAARVRLLAHPPGAGLAEGVDPARPETWPTEPPKEGGVYFRALRQRDEWTVNVVEIKARKRGRFYQFVGVQAGLPLTGDDGLRWLPIPLTPASLSRPASGEGGQM